MIRRALVLCLLVSAPVSAQALEPLPILVMDFGIGVNPQLVPSSTYARKATDGTDLGATFDIAGVIARAIGGQATIEACNVGAQPFVVASGAPFGITFLMPSSVPASDTDPTQVPLRVDGYTAWIDGGTRHELRPTPIGAGDPCPQGTTFAGQRGFEVRLPEGVSRGQHTLTVLAWNWKLDAIGNPTSIRQEGPAVVVPFVAVDPAHQGPPPGPKNVIIRR
jgi:hypothetical protein